jgi:ribonuclease HI
MLVIKQMKGEYKVKSANLIYLYNEAKLLEKEFQCISFNHIYRENNKRADELSNIAISKDYLDEKMYYDKDDEDEADEYLFEEEK